MLIMYLKYFEQHCHKVLYILVVLLECFSAVIILCVENDEIFILGLYILLLQLIAVLIHYPYTMPLPGLANCSAFLEQNFVNPIKLQLRK